LRAASWRDALSAAEVHSFLVRVRSTDRVVERLLLTRHPPIARSTGTAGYVPTEPFAPIAGNDRNVPLNGR
jgi:hypothetical protein